MTAAEGSVVYTEEEDPVIIAINTLWTENRRNSFWSFFFLKFFGGLADISDFFFKKKLEPIDYNAVGVSYIKVRWDQHP